MTHARAIAWLVALAVVAGSVAVVLRDGPADARTATSPPSATAAPGFPRDLALPDGGTLRLDGPPQRIVVANTAVLDTVTALVPPERVAAICRQAFTWSEIARQPGEWRGRPSFPVLVTESVLAYDPDLVLCSPHSLPEAIAALRELGIPLIAVPLAEDLEGVRANLRLVARAVGADSRAADLERDLDHRIEQLHADADRRAQVRALFYTWSGNEGWSAGNGTLQDVALALAGVRNATAEAGHHGPVRLTFEQLLAIDPDVFIVPATFGEVIDATAEQLRTDVALRDLRAVRAVRIVELHPSLFSTTSHEIVTAAEEIADSIDHLPPLPPVDEERDR